MMRYVRAFNSMDAIRTFLNALGCFDELLSLEEEFGNFLEAAKIAKLKGELLVEADLFGKAGHFKQSAMLILWYVFANSLWSSGSKGWPLKQFPQKEELLEKAKSFAKNESNQFFELVCLEAEILLHDQSNLFIMKQHLNSSQRHNSIKGEILSARKILDAHFHLNSSEYVWENDLVLDLASFLDEKLSKNEVSIETLIYSWSFWKDKIVNIFECLGCLETQDVSEYGSYGEFCLNYLGVQRHFNNLSPTFVLMNSDADWVREVDYRYIKRNGKLISLDVHHFVSASRNYWSSELISVGMKVLTNLESLYEFSIKNSFSLFCQSRNAAMENLAGNNIGPGELSLKRMLHGALIDAYNANWEKEEDYISPVCFLYLVERQLILLSCSQGKCRENVKDAYAVGVEKSPPEYENRSLFGEAAKMLDELKQLHAALDVSEVKLRNDNSTIGELLNKLQSRKPRMEPLLNHIFAQKDKSFGSDGWDEDIGTASPWNGAHLFSSLDGEFEQIRGEILRKDPVPKLEECYLMVRRVSVRHATMNGELEKSEAAAMVSRNRSNQNRSSQNQQDQTKSKTSTGINKSAYKCTHYDQPGHTKDRCFEIVGYPEWWDHNRDSRKRNASKASPTGAPASKTSTVAIVETNAEEDVAKKSTAFVATRGNGGKVLNSSALVSNSAWIIDSRATDHMTFDSE
ncbi:hypothetical protein GH714_016810 [Hevea brasiliensis]|uniref:Uncharacterized protein n=1 Tax=Hevea brasiliensis TaxID=3981 RepID=A0A6A6LEV5_HEVBR|nr:hypothetical protein GH714_016810 [Hevea brasiliensis]